MNSAEQGAEVVVRVKNSIGVMRDLTRVVADRGVDIWAVNSWVEGGDGIIRMVTDDTRRTVDVLRANHYAPTEREVILVHMPHKSGMLKALMDKLAREDIDVHHLYASATPGESTSLMVMSTSYNDRALVILNE